MRQSFVNNTDSNNTENAIGSLSNVINHGMEMVDHVLNQTTVYSVGESVDPVTTVLKLADQEVEEVKNYYFHNDTGNFIIFSLDECSLGLWKYGLWRFSEGGTKLERFLHKNQHTERKLLNFEFWINGELSKIGHHFSNKVI